MRQSTGVYAIVGALAGVWLLLATPLPIGSAGRAAPLVDPLFLPSPLHVGGALAALLRSGVFQQDLAHTAGRLVGALTVACSVGIPVGLFFATHRRLYTAIEGLIDGLRSIPAAALFPYFLLVIGVGDATLVALASYNSLMIMIINTASGAFLANPRRLFQARLLGISSLVLAKDVLFWEALPQIFIGVRVATGYALALIIAAEMFIGTSDYGLGRRIFDAQAAYRSAETFAVIIVASGLGVAANALVGLLERRSLHWVPLTLSEREDLWRVGRP
jgi:ABC-type nitrate/sulfonate/bicarbonate transport system permease component